MSRSLRKVVDAGVDVSRHSTILTPDEPTERGWDEFVKINTSDQFKESSQTKQAARAKQTMPYTLSRKIMQDMNIIGKKVLQYNLQPMSMILPGVIGFKLYGKLKNGVIVTNLDVLFLDQYFAIKERKSKNDASKKADAK